MARATDRRSRPRSQHFEPFHVDIATEHAALDLARQPHPVFRRDLAASPGATVDLDADLAGVVAYGELVIALLVYYMTGLGHVAAVR
jgi:hypothetical protein